MKAPESINMKSSDVKVVLTGHRRKRRHLVLVDEREAWLSPGLFSAFSELVLLRYVTETGIGELDSVSATRIRKLIDVGRADTLIDCCGGHSYRLVPNVYSDSFDKTLYDLDGTGIIAPRFFDTLEKSISKCQSG